MLSVLSRSVAAAAVATLRYERWHEGSRQGGKRDVMASGTTIGKEPRIGEQRDRDGSDSERRMRQTQTERWRKREKEREPKQKKRLSERVKREDGTGEGSLVGAKGDGGRFIAGI